MQKPPGAITHLVCDCDGVLLDRESIALRVLHGYLLPLLKNPADGGKLHQAIASRLGMLTGLLLDALDAEFGFNLSASRYTDIDMRDLPALITGRAMENRRWRRAIQQTI